LFTTTMITAVMHAIENNPTGSTFALALRPSPNAERRLYSHSERVAYRRPSRTPW
jgi:hypothetical protein